MVKQISAGDGKLPGAFAFVRFSPDGKFLATGGHNADAKVWNAQTGKLLRTLDSSYAIRTFSPDGQSVLHAHRHGAAIHNLIAERDVCLFRPPVQGILFTCFSPDFKRVAAVAPSSNGGIESSAENGQGSIYVFNVPARAFDPSRFDDAPLDKLWDDLNSDNDLRRQVVLKAFRSAPKQAVALIAEKVHPIAKDQQDRVEKLIVILDDESFVRRDEAMEEVQRLAHQFAPLLQKKLSKAAAGEVRNRLTFVLDRMGEEKLPAPLRIQLRAIALLEDLTTKEARDLLGRLADGADGARLTSEARGALERLEEKGK
jgi:hypothetical protein